MHLLLRALTSLHIGNNRIPIEHMHEIIAVVEAAPAMKVLCGVPFRDKTIAELDVRGQSLGVEGAVVVSRYLERNGALEILRMGNTQLAAKEAGRALAGALARNSVLKELDVSGNDWYTNSGDQGDGVGFAKELAVGIGANRSLVKFDVSKSSLCADGATLVAAALQDNHVMTDLNISDNHMTLGGSNISRAGSNYREMSGVVAMSNAIPTMGALTSLNISNNHLGICDDLPEGWTHDGSYYDCYRHHRVGNQRSPPAGAQSTGVRALADSIKNHGAFVSANLLGNNIGAEQARQLAAILKAHPTLKSLCGNEGGEAELDMSGQNLGADGVAMLAPEIVANGALTSLNMSSNGIGGRWDSSSCLAAEALQRITEVCHARSVELAI